MNWTPEPWTDLVFVVRENEQNLRVSMSQADWQRAVACVNAMAGIADPAAYRKFADELIKLDCMARAPKKEIK